MIKKLFSTIILLLMVTACAGRIPSDSKTAGLARGYFKKYGGKYKDTVFYKNPPQQVEVKRTQELQRSLANSFAVLQLQDGQQIPVILTLLHKFPRGWRISSWEWVHQEPLSPAAEAPPSSPSPEPTPTPAPQ
jgi:hypothetical protein